MIKLLCSYTALANQEEESGSRCAVSLCFSNVYLFEPIEFMLQPTHRKVRTDEGRRAVKHVIVEAPRVVSRPTPE